MPKNIILCSDGTGNTAIKRRGTNVFKLFEAVDLTGHQTRLELDTQLRRRAAAAEGALQSALAEGGYMLDAARHDIARGVWSYWMFVIAWPLFVLRLGSLSIAMMAGVSMRTAWSLLSLGTVGLSIILFVGAAVSSKRADCRMSDRFSEFWHTHQNRLRESLKQAHREARQEQRREPASV